MLQYLARETFGPGAGWCVTRDIAEIRLEGFGNAARFQHAGTEILRPQAVSFPSFQLACQVYGSTPPCSAHRRIASVAAIKAAGRSSSQLASHGEQSTQAAELLQTALFQQSRAEDPRTRGGRQLAKEIARDGVHDDGRRLGGGVRAQERVQGEAPAHGGRRGDEEEQAGLGRRQQGRRPVWAPEEEGAPKSGGRVAHGDQEH